jgi:hypothetical protein
MGEAEGARAVECSAADRGTQAKGSRSGVVESFSAGVAAQCSSDKSRLCAPLRNHGLLAARARGDYAAIIDTTYGMCGHPRFAFTKEVDRPSGYDGNV